jgi:hypothetical protein
VTDKFHKENDDAQKIKDNRAKIAMHGSSKHPPSLGVSNEPRIVHEARKRRALEVENEISKGPGGRGAATDSRLMKMFNNQKRKETESRVARAIFACDIPFNVVRSPYWKDMVKAINEAPQGFKGPNYEKLITVLLQKERSSIHDILKPIRSSWTSTGVSIISNGWADTKRRPLVNVIASSPTRAMFLRAEDCSGEVKDSKFIIDILISAIEQVGPANVVQVITNNVHVCKVVALIVESRYVYHHQSQAMYPEYSKLELLKVVKTRYASNFIMLRRLVEVKSALMSMVVGVTWAEWRQTNSERVSMVRRVLIDEDWWSKVEFLLKFTSPAFELLRDADTDKPFLGEIYDGMDTMVEKTVEIITQEAPTLFFVEVDFVEHVRSIIVTRWNGFNTPLHTLAHALNPKFYDEEFIAQRNGKRKAPHKDKEVATGVKKAFQRLFPSSQQTKVREEFACFAAELEDFADISALEERSTMNPIKWWTCHGANGVYLQSLATRILSQVASSSSAERNWSTYGFIHSMKCNRKNGF